MAANPVGKFRCPGIFREIEIVACGNCGDEVEFFAGDRILKCPCCGVEVKRKSSSCLDRCPARQSSCYRALKAELETRESSGSS